jgi:hypothetical protein
MGTNEDKVYYVHLRTEGAGAVTFALREDGDVPGVFVAGGGRAYQVGWACCSPRDQISLPRGRLIALGRLNTRPLTVVVPVAEGRQEEVQGTCRRVLELWREECVRADVPTVAYLDTWRLPRWLPGFLGAWARQEGAA